MNTTYMLKVPEDVRPAIADVHPWILPDYEDGTVHIFLIHRINVPERARGKGYGTTLLKQILKDADDEKQILMLSPEPSGGLDFEQLTSWYKRHGFVFTRSGAMMERKPA